VFSLSVNVKLVQVDAVVRDGAGKPVTGLQKEDFIVYDDGALQQVQHFSRDELPLAVALVIDRSSSVAPIMDRIQNAAFKALQQLKRGDQVALFSFAADIDLLEPLTTNRQRVANRIGDIRPGGGTRIFDAVSEALRYLQDNAEERRRAVILISDNLESDSRTSANTVVQSGLKTETVIYSIRIRDDSPRVTLVPTLPPGLTRGSTFDRVERLATETGGEVFDAKSSALDAVLATAVNRLKLRYTLGYAPSSTASPDRFHTIEVRLTDRFGAYGSNYTVMSRRGYYE
jgi:VWFA-related protein